MELKELDFQDFTPLEKILEQISIITDKDYLELYDDEINVVLNEYLWINTPPHVNIKSNFKHISFGNFIDLENFFIDKTPIENIDKICAVIYGYEDFEAKKKEIRQQPITKHYATLENYIKYRTQLLDTYKGLFEDTDDDDDEAEKQDKKTIGESWLNILYSLSNSDITKANTITEMSLVMVFNWLSIESKKNHPSVKKS